MKGTLPKEFVAAATEPQTQFAALCWRYHRERVEVLLVTSRETGRWVLPKGWPIKGGDGPATAVQEAWEEAGVEGEIAAEPLGDFSYQKIVNARVALPCVVSVFALRVGRLASKFPERNERRRKWFSAEKAARNVAEPDLRALLAAVGAGKIALPGADVRKSAKSKA